MRTEQKLSTVRLNSWFRLWYDGFKGSTMQAERNRERERDREKKRKRKGAREQKRARKRGSDSEQKSTLK